MWVPLQAHGADDVLKRDKTQGGLERQKERAILKRHKVYGKPVELLFISRILILNINNLIADICVCIFTSEISP